MREVLLVVLNQLTPTRKGKPPRARATVTIHIQRVLASPALAMENSEEPQPCESRNNILRLISIATRKVTTNVTETETLTQRLERERNEMMFKWNQYCLSELLADAQVVTSLVASLAEPQVVATDTPLTPTQPMHPNQQQQGSARQGVHNRWPNSNYKGKNFIEGFTKKRFNSGQQRAPQDGIPTQQQGADNQKTQVIPSLPKTVSPNQQ